MKLLATAATVMLAASSVHGECGVVELESHPSKQDVHVLFTLHGKPAEYMALDITILGSDRNFTLRRVTDRHGAINLKKLSPGDNYVTFSTAPGVKPNSMSTVRLDVSERVSTSSQISLELKPQPTRYEFPAVDMSPPIEFTGRTFTGRIVDPIGNPISGAQIAVYRRPFDDTAKPMTFQSDGQGSFAAALEPGGYTAVVTSPGFKLSFKGFEIKRDAPEQRMSIQMTIGDVC